MDLKEIVRELEKTMQCNCDLDNWEPEAPTGHSYVCRIRKAALERMRFPHAKQEGLIGAGGGKKSVTQNSCGGSEKE